MLRYARHARLGHVPAMLVLIVLAASCTNEPAPTGVGSGTQAATEFGGFTPIGYISLTDGTIGEVDLLNMKVVGTLKNGHRGVHRHGVLPDNRTIFTADPDTNRLVKITLTEDGKQVASTKDLGPAPANPVHFMSSPAGDKVMLTSRIELKDFVVFAIPTDLADDSLVIIDVATEKVEHVVKLQSPTAAEFSLDGKTLYASNVHHYTVSVVDVATGVEVKRVPLVDDLSKVPLKTGESHDGGIGISPDGKTLCIADGALGSVTLFDTATMARKDVYTFDAQPHDCRFTPDNGELWVVTYGRQPAPGNEVSNATIDTHIYSFDIAKHEQRVHTKAPICLSRLLIPSWSKDQIYFGTAVGGVQSYDRKTGELTGEVVIGGLGRPVICGGVAY